MNYRQLKKQYKRKHGSNPPKGYSRAQIRTGIKLNTWQNNLAVAAYGAAQGLARGFKVISEAVKRMASIGPISEELRAILERTENHEEVTP